MPVNRQLPPLSATTLEVYQNKIAEINLFFSRYSASQNDRIERVCAEIEALVRDFNATGQETSETSTIPTHGLIATKLTELFSQMVQDYRQNKSQEMIILILRIWWLRNEWNNNIRSIAVSLFVPLDSVINQYKKMVNDFQRNIFLNKILFRTTIVLTIIALFTFGFLLYLTGNYMNTSEKLAIARDLINHYCPDQPILQKNGLLYSSVQTIYLIMCCQIAGENLPLYDGSCSQDIQNVLDGIPAAIEEYNETVLYSIMFVSLFFPAFLGCMCSAKVGCIMERDIEENFRTLETSHVGISDFDPLFRSLFTKAANYEASHAHSSAPTFPLAPMENGRQLSPV